MQLKDSILAININEQKLLKFLEKVGYDLIVAADFAAARAILDSRVVDAIIFDGIAEPDAANLLEFIRSQKKMAKMPIFFLAEDSLQVREIKNKGLTRIEAFEKPFSVGSIASRIATELRLSKFAGVDEASASVAEMNSSLRDLTARMQKDLEAARKLQQALLPQSLPQDTRYQMAVSYEPLEEVGGDWFYVAKEAVEDKLLVQIADVTGHGLAAAFIGSMTKLALTAAAETEPDKLLVRMNSLMAPQLPEGNFVTVFCYLYDPATGQLRYARAGHNPALLFESSSGKVRQLMGDGFAIGFFEETEYELLVDQLDPKDILLLYTDALTESQNMAGVCYGVERMEDCLKKLPDSASATDVITALINDFEDFRGGRLLKDDVTIIALRRVI